MFSPLSTICKLAEITHKLHFLARVILTRLHSSWNQIAVVVVPKAEEHAQRTISRAKDLGKEVPLEAVNEMKGMDT